MGTLLVTRGIHSELSCKRCGEPESIAHLFISCPFAIEFWAKVPLRSPVPASASLVSLKEWLALSTNNLALPPIGLVTSPLIPWLLWNLWTARNKLVFEGSIYTVEDIISKALVDARAWEEANVKKIHQQKKQPPVSGVSFKTPSCWCDGAWHELSKTGGMGWIIKNEEGEVLCRGSANRTYVCSALMSEALAMREALRKAKDLNLSSLQLFSDSQVLVSALREGRDVNEIAGILQDIRNLATLFCPVYYSFVPRLENSQADALASSSLARIVVVGD